MSRSYSFVVLGEAEPAGSKKAFVPLHPKTKQPYRRPGGGIVVSVVDANPHSKGWKKRVAKIAHDECGAPLLTGPLKVTLVFYRERPQSHFGVSGLNKSGREAPFPTTKPDAGKLARGTIDAMTGVMYVDDAQIVEEIAIKRYGSPPRAEITVEEVTTPEAENQSSLFANLEPPAPWETTASVAVHQPPTPDRRDRESDEQPGNTSKNQRYCGKRSACLVSTGGTVMNETARILCAIPNKASISITALLARLGVDTLDLSTPIFTTLNTLEDAELITVIRPGNGRVASVQLTPLGAERAREAQQEAQR